MPNPGQKVNREHWKERCLRAEALVTELQAKVKRLEANGANEGDIARIKAAAFAAGVDAVSKHI